MLFEITSTGKGILFLHLSFCIYVVNIAVQGNSKGMAVLLTCDIISEKEPTLTDASVQQLEQHP